MARSYDIRDLVTLPRLDANGADALVTELLTCAKGRKLAAPIESARKNLAGAQKELRAALTSRLQMLPADDSARARAADQAEDAAFSATFDWLTGFSKLPETYDEPALAGRLLDALFPGGLKFTQLPYKLEWAEADARLRAVAEDPTLEAIFDELGGDVFLKNLRKTHKEYGDTLGITTAKSAGAPSPAVSEPLLSVRQALRVYALRVLASSDDDDTELAESLLAPLVAWESLAATPAAKPAPKQPPSPPSPPSPALPAEPTPETEG